MGALFLVLLFLQSNGYHSTSLSKTLASPRMEELAGRTSLEIIREDIEAIAVVRVPVTPPHAQVQRYILNELQSHLYWKVETHKFVDSTPLGEKEFTNIIATWSPLPKSNPRFALPEN